MITSEYILELDDVTYTGRVQNGSFWQRVTGRVPTGMILKEVALEVRGGEVMAVLGSKGSGKKALLDVISHRAMGSVEGHVTLNSVPLTSKLFRESCGVVTQRVELIRGLTVRQTLNYAAQLGIGSKISGAVRRARVKQVMADLALNQVINRDVGQLTLSEHRRLSIGAHLVRDPVVLLLDEPTGNLDPLNAYFVISILSNYAKKYNRIIMLTMEKPRSDIFPFLDRVTYLCLGDVVYTGSTRMMLDYFRNVGFPCPELENPLMYYLCLATVDRRSRDRLMDSSNQIALLVQKFKTNGMPFRKVSGQSKDVDFIEPVHKIPLTYYGTPSSFSILTTQISRAFCVLGNGVCGFNVQGLLAIWLKLLLLPSFFLFIFLFYFRLSDFQRSFVTTNGLLFNSLAVTSFLSACITAVTFATFRTRYYQELREGNYGGPLFVMSQFLFNFPLSVLTVFAGSAIIYWATGLRPDGWRWLMYTGVLWTCYTFVELQTMALMSIIKSSYTATVTSLFFNIFYLVTASGTVRTLSGLPQWLYYLSYVMIYRYAGAVLNENQFWDNYDALAANNGTVTTSCERNSGPGCAFLNGTHYLSQRYSLQENELNLFSNFGICFAFYGGMVVINLLLYAIPMPMYIKRKFRD